MLNKLLPKSIFELITNPIEITEIRLRLGQNVVFYNLKGIIKTKNHKVTKSDIESILSSASNGSLYAVSDMLNKGYLIFEKGIRIGALGEGVLEQNKLISVKNICCLTIRIPHEISVMSSLSNISDSPKNTLIISPPGAGKTTLLRAMTKYYSNLKFNTLLIDERYELSATYKGKSTLDVGKFTDIISGVPKSIAYELGVRTMRPDLICTDELYDRAEVEALKEAVYGGIKTIATAHAKSIEDVKNRQSINGVLDIIEQVITLSNYPYIGTVENIEDLK